MILIVQQLHVLNETTNTVGFEYVTIEMAQIIQQITRVLNDTAISG